MSFFVFDGENFEEVTTLDAAVEGSQEAIECYSDQCDPGWPEEVENICYGVILGRSFSRPLTPEEEAKFPPIDGVTHFVQYAISTMENGLPSPSENPSGLHNRYVVIKQDGEWEPSASYFVLRLDNYGDDDLHIEACRAAAIAYADVVQGTRDSHLAKVGAELRALVRRFASEA